MNEIKRIEEAIAHIDEVLQSNCNDACKRDHTELKKWLLELLSIKKAGNENRQVKQVIATALPIVRLRSASGGLRGDSDEEQAWLILKELENAGFIILEKEKADYILDFLYEFEFWVKGERIYLKKRERKDLEECVKYLEKKVRRKA